MYDYGRRFYDPVIARFSVIDRFSEKYKNLNSYHYTNNNPIRFIDINGDSIGVSGSATAFAILSAMVERGTEGHYKANIDKNGVVSFNRTGLSDKFEMSSDAKSYYKVLSKAVSGKGMAKFSLVDQNDKASSQIKVGDNGRSPNSATPNVHTIDVADIQNLGFHGIVNEKGGLAHEITEGYDMQVNLECAGPAHNKAIGNESVASGSSGAGYNLQGGSINGNQVDVPVKDFSGKVVRTVNINFDNYNNVIGVTNNQK